jgi:hypothetical protein
MKMAKMSDEDMAQLRKLARRDKSLRLTHLIECYYVMFDNACDETAQTLEFKPEILEAMEFYKNRGEQ